MLTLDRKKLLDGYLSRFGPLTNELAEAFKFLLPQIEKDTRFSDTETDRRQLAYCLATFKWETAHTMRPIDEFGSNAYFNSRYGPQTKVGKMLGNTKAGDGALFHGRGYVQITGRRNYTKAKALTGVDLIAQPDRAKEPEVAYQIAIQGMKDGWFTGRKLSQFIKDGHTDFENARTIINGHDKASIIAGIASRYSEVLLSAMN
ncbi:MAG: glycoside hydrolase family 19 protein [Chitinophagaceae bacterium]